MTLTATAQRNEPDAMTPPSRHQHDPVEKTDTTYLAIRRHLEEAPTRDHQSPCTELDRRTRWATKAGACAIIVVSGAWAPLWVQVGKSMERDTDRRAEIAATAATAARETAALKLELATLSTRTEERLTTQKSELLGNQAIILAEIRKLTQYGNP